jgi:HTH-type transcriptional regulator, sugar sensing transcriptional regulator
MENIIKALKLLGITENEAKVYLVCLELGSGNIHEVANRAKIKRTSIYNYLEDMKSKGIISTTESDRGVLLIPTDPNNLIKKSKEITSDLEGILPDLMGIFSMPGNKPKVKFFEGVEGIKQSFEIMLKSDGPIHSIVDVDQMMSVLDNKYMWEISERRAAKGAWFHAIFKDGPEGRKAIERGKEIKVKGKLVKEGKFSTEINIYDNKVALNSYRRPLSAVIIEDQAIADTMRTMWKGWWATIPDPEKT